MLKQSLVILVSCFVFSMMPFVGNAQVNAPAYTTFVQEVIRQTRVSAPYQNSGEPSELTMVYTVSNGKKTIQYFPQDISPRLKEGLWRSEAVVKKTKWEKIFPALRKEEEFSIVLPMVFRFTEDPDISQQQEAASIGRLFNFAREVKPPYQICATVFVTVLRPTR